MVSGTGPGIVLVGGGGHCQSVLDVLESCGLGVGGVVHGAHCAPEPVLGCPCLGHDADLSALRQRFTHALVTVGQIKSAELRRRIFAMLEQLSFTLPVVVAPTAHVSRHAALGRGTVVMQHALVNAAATVGVNGIINSGALVEHGCHIEDHCHIAVGAVLCGEVRVGAGTFVGAGAVVRQGVRVGAQCVIGMGMVVAQDVPPGTVMGSVQQESV